MQEKYMAQAQDSKQSECKWKMKESRKQRGMNYHGEKVDPSSNKGASSYSYPHFLCRGKFGVRLEKRVHNV